jgi:eukaryotic-like serine/threonine-protein kinase
MNPERQREVSDILAAVLARAPADRPDFLSLVCGADAGLRRELEALVLARERGDDLPETLDIGPQPGAPAARADPPILEPGVSLGPYQVLGRLGAGGMGQVYRAYDPRLRREVAIKVMSHRRLAEPAARQRFEREARAAGALNHPNILAVFDVGVQDGAPYVVTELLEGETVQQRLARGPMPPGECLEVACQIAEGLAAAHRKGILHRDLKPANLFLTRDGRTKILDFGMAKQLATGLEDGITTAATVPGTVLGTVGYMSPEQIRDQALDPRSDLFSFGAVLYEMLAGSRAFGGASAVEIMIAVLSDEPPPLPAAPPAPAALEQLVRRCLQKDPASRPRDAGELCAALRDLALAGQDGAARHDMERAGQDGAAAQDMAHAPQGRAASRDAMGTGQGGAFAGGAGVSGAVTRTTSEPAPRAPVQAARRRWRLAAAIAAVLAAGASAFLMPRSNSTAAKTGTQRVSYLSLTAGEGKETFPSLHPGGDLFAYVKWIGGRSHILLQRVGDTSALKDLSESSTADDTQPAFSPDGAQIAFRSERDGGGIFVMGATGELVRQLTHFGYNPAWSPDGQEVLVATLSADNPVRHAGQASKLYRVKADGSGSSLLSAGEAMQPSWSPHGTRIAYWGVSPSGRREIWTMSAGGGEQVRITDDENLNWSPAWFPDSRYLYYSSNRSGLQSLWRVRIDESSGRPLEEPEEVATPSSFSGLLSFSRDSRNMIYASSETRSNLERQGFDPQREILAGTRDPIAGNLHEVLSASVSADGRWIAYSSSGRHEDVFILHTDGSGRRRMTSDPWRNRSPVWFGDGSSILVYSNRSSSRGGKYEAWAIHLGGALEQLTAVPGQGVFDPVATPDGSLLACNLEKSGPALFRLTVPLARRMPQLLPAMSGGATFSAFSWSPDGRRLGGFDSEGRLVTYSLATRTFQKLDARGTLPIWLHDNRRLVFSAKGGIYLVDPARPGSASRLLLMPAAGFTFRPIGLSPDDHVLYLLSSTEEGHIYLRTSN